MLSLFIIINPLINHIFVRSCKLFRIVPQSLRSHTKDQRSYQVSFPWARRTNVKKEYRTVNLKLVTLEKLRPPKTLEKFEWSNTEKWCRLIKNGWRFYYFFACIYWYNYYDTLDLIFNTIMWTPFGKTIRNSLVIVKRIRQFLSPLWWRRSQCHTLLNP